MEISELAIRLLLLFLPGILASYILNTFTTTHTPTKFIFLLESFVLGILSYAALTVTATILGVVCPEAGFQISFFSTLTSAKVDVRFGEVFYASGHALVLSIGLVCIVNYKLHFRLAHFLRITKKFADHDVWSYTLTSPRTGWITVRDHDNDLIYDGWYEAFSEDSRNPELLLGDVSVYTNQTGEPLYQVGSLYLSLKGKRFSIEFRDIPVSPECQWKEEVDDGAKKRPGQAAPKAASRRAAQAGRRARKERREKS